MTKYRINRFLALCNVASRRKSEELINAGKVTINSRLAVLADTVDIEKDVVVYEGKKLTVPQEHEYFILNKPENVISAVSDDRGRKTVSDFLPDGSTAVPVGRLDFDTTGVLLLTTDGELLYRLTHPSFGVKKRYQAFITGHFDIAEAEKIEKGIEIEDVLMKADKVVVLNSFGNKATVEMTLTEGRKREVKELVRAVGCRVRTLRRTAFAGILCGKMELGELRELSDFEVKALKKLTGLK